VWIAGDTGKLARVVPGGLATDVPNCGRNWNAIWGRTDARLYLAAATAGGSGLYHRDAGAGVGCYSYAVNKTFDGLDVTGRHLFAVSTSQIYRFSVETPTDGGLVGDVGGRTFFGVAALSADEAWAVGRSGGGAGSPEVYRFNGSSWAQQSLGGGEQLNAISAAAPNALVAVGNNATTYVSDGVTWTPITATRETSADYLSVVAFGRDHFYVATSTGHVLRYSRGAWSDANVPGSVNALNAIDGKRPDDLWVVGPQSDFVLHWHEP
jgi:hypothetical protein